jgi:hypothetical protein
MAGVATASNYGVICYIDTRLSSLRTLELTVEGVHRALCLELRVHGRIGALREGELIAKRGHATTLLLTTVCAAAVRFATHGMSTTHGMAATATHRAATTAHLTRDHTRELGECLVQRTHLCLYAGGGIQQVVVTRSEGGHATTLGKYIAIVGVGRTVATTMLLTIRATVFACDTMFAACMATLLMVLCHSI